MKKIAIAVLALSFALVSCSDKEEASNAATVRAYMVDAPGDYDAVMIDVQDVRVNVKSDSSADSTNGWQSLDGFSPAIYDLLELVNGNEALLGEIAITEGKIGQIRLVLGENNSLLIDSVSHDLTIPSGSESGLKIKINEKLEDGQTYNLIVDFDVARSIHQTGNGEYKLKPVIKAHLESAAGSIAGTIAPDSIDAVIYAVAGNDSNSTFADENGNFLFNSLSPDTYEVSAVPSDSSLNTVSISGVTVTEGQTTTIDTLRF